VDDESYTGYLPQEIECCSAAHHLWHIMQHQSTAREGLGALWDARAQLRVECAEGMLVIYAVFSLAEPYSLSPHTHEHTLLLSLIPLTTVQHLHDQRGHDSLTFPSALLMVACVGSLCGLV
jgi:hypothetical protein